MEEYSEIVVYLPDQELHYQVFAAVPYSKKHVLYYHDFNDPEVFQAFLDKEVLSVRSINAAIDQEAEVSVTDRLLILSTCLKGDNQQRYLVVAKQLQNMMHALLQQDVTRPFHLLRSVMHLIFLYLHLLM